MRIQMYKLLKSDIVMNNFQKIEDKIWEFKCINY
jgi:hypothetical protein